MHCHLLSCVAEHNHQHRHLIFYLGCEVGKGLCHTIGALGEGRKLENAHGSVPDDGLGIGQGILEGL